MYYRESIPFMEGEYFQSLKRVPKWAREERMESSVPLMELWKYTDPSAQKNNRATGIFGIIRRFGK